MVLVYSRTPNITCARPQCGKTIRPDDDRHFPHDADCVRSLLPRWCAKSREGWCAVVPNEEPAEGSWSVATACGFGITLPWGYERRLPDCFDCLDVACSCETKPVHIHCCPECRAALRTEHPEMIAPWDQEES